MNERSLAFRNFQTRIREYRYARSDFKTISTLLSESRDSLNKFSTLYIKEKERERQRVQSEKPHMRRN